jgi:hypothetical protein
MDELAADGIQYIRCYIPSVEWVTLDNRNKVRFDVLTAVTLNNAAFWVVAPHAVNIPEDGILQKK